jgi:hypothetical protein
MADFPPNQSPYQAPHPEQQTPDTAGSTQMFRAFVDEGAGAAQPRPASGPATTYGTSRGPRTGLIVGIVVAVLVIAVVAYVAMS